MYDYGKSKNQEVYGQSQVPAVPIENFNLQTALISGDMDGLSTPADVNWLSQTLGNKVIF